MSRRIKGTGSLYWDKSRERWIYKCRYRDNKGVLHTMQASDISKKNIRSKMEKVQLQLNIIEKGIPQYSFKEWTEKWLDIIEKKLDYQVWCFGHYHGEKTIIQEDGRFIQMLYQYVDILE